MKDRFGLTTIWTVKRHDQSYNAILATVVEDALKNVGKLNEEWLDAFRKNSGFWHDDPSRFFSWGKNQYVNTNLQEIREKLPFNSLDVDNQIRLLSLSKMKADAIYNVLKPYDTEIIKGNVALNEGLNRALNLITGQGGTAYSNANARIGVGNDGTAPSASQTGLLGGSTAFKAMDTGFPTVPATQKTDFQGTFGDTDAQFAWLEETIDNGSGSNENLNRANTNLGTKPGTETWVLKGTITGS